MFSFSQIFLSEYAIVWATFIAIQVVGIDVGIVLGVLVAIVSHVVATVQITSVTRVSMQSRAVWTPRDYKLLHDHGYHPLQPKIVTLEITGTIFFGSSLQLLERISEEIGFNVQEEELADETLLRSPHHSSYLMSMDMDRRQSFREPHKATVLRRPPKSVVLNLTQVPNLDASAARGCFLQLAKMCAKRDMILCAAGANPRVDWMLRSHDVAYDLEEEERVKARLQARTGTPSQGSADTKCERVLLFLTIHEALEFCENVLIHELNANRLSTSKRPSFVRLDQYHDESENSITTVISHVLGLDSEERKIVEALEDERYHSTLHLGAGDLVFAQSTYPNAFYLVLKGSVAVSKRGSQRQSRIVTGAGPVSQPGSSSRLLGQSLSDMDGSLISFWPVGGVFGYVDYMLERPRRFQTVAAHDRTIVARFNRSQMALLRAENTSLDVIMQRFLLHASIMDLANCTCRD